MSAHVVLVGGGLANSLIAYRLRQLQPRVRITLIEREPHLGGNHTWSFHTTDLTAEQNDWMAPFVVHTWRGYDVQFPAHSRRLEGGYHSIDSERLHRVVSESLANAVRLKTEVTTVEARRVEFTDGENLDNCTVIDGRGFAPDPHLKLGYQKFLGQRINLDSEHGLERPILMDATVPQKDGYRFVYTLPFTPTSVLVEDTRYSDSADLADQAMRSDIADYLDCKGWKPERIVGEERGVLPIALSGDVHGYWNGSRSARSGLRAALFHATTGYSLPWAVRLADEIASKASLDSETLHAMTRDRSIREWRRQRFYRALNRMLFLACEPQERYRVLERFYRLSEPLIRRFYAGRTSWIDCVRLLAGRPPLPVHRAIGCLWTHRDSDQASSER